MDFVSTRVTQVTHRATVAAADATAMLKTAVLSYAQAQLGLTDPVVVSSKADVGADGAVTVEIVEAHADASTTPPTDKTATVPPAPTIFGHSGFARA